MHACPDDELLIVDALDTALSAVCVVAGVVERERVDVRDAGTGWADGKHEELSVHGFGAPSEGRAGDNRPEISAELIQRGCMHRAPSA